MHFFAKLTRKVHLEMFFTILHLVSDGQVTSAGRGFMS